MSHDLQHGVRDFKPVVCFILTWLGQFYLIRQGGIISVTNFMFHFRYVSLWRKLRPNRNSCPVFLSQSCFVQAWFPFCACDVEEFVLPPLLEPLLVLCWFTGQALVFTFCPSSAEPIDGGMGFSAAISWMHNLGAESEDCKLERVSQWCEDACPVNQHCWFPRGTGIGHCSAFYIYKVILSSASWLWPQTLPSIVVDAFMPLCGSNFNLTFITELNVLELTDPIFQNTLFMRRIPLQCRPHFRGNGRRGGTIGCKWSHSFQ